jgi:hypothetical protein
MPLMKLQFQPGLNREITAYSDEGGWWDADKVRFRMGYPEKIGGWQKFNPAPVLGVCRAIHPWVALDGNEYIGFGTSLKYYVSGSGALNDITPLRLPSPTLTNPFTTVSAGSGIVTVTDTAHGCYQGDFVTFSGATAVSGITTAQLNKEHQILTVPTVNTYTIDTGGSASAGAVNGGGTVLAEYQINTGLDNSILGTGWGAGPWGGIGTGATPPLYVSSPPTSTGWGDPATTTTTGAQLRLWGHDNFGENLLFNVRNGGIYYWAKSTSYPRAVELTSLSGATTGKTPTIAKQVMVSDNDRHVIAFGCDDEFSIGTQDPLLIRFSDAENVAEWRSLATTSAGSIRIGSGSAIVTAVETKQQILVITDTSVHAMQFLGPPFTFGLTMVSDNISITSPNSAIAVDDAVYWMGEGDFYIYNGTVSQIPCDVKDYIFSRIDTQQTQKVVAGANINYGEVWWFYQSTSSTNGDNDSYVCYNYQQRIWYFGTMSRSAWTHKNLGIYPVAASPDDNYTYLHEFGTDDGSQNPPVGITAFIESTGQDLGDGDQFAFIWRMIPDITFRDSITVNPQATFTVMMSNFPGADFSQTNSNVITKTTSYPVEQFTHQVFTRLRGRSFTFKISSNEVGTTWRLGAPRLDIRTDGRR